MLQLGKPDPYQIIPETWKGIIAVPIIAGSALAMSHSVLATIGTLAAFWAMNQYRTYMVSSDIAKEIFTVRQG